MDYYCMVLILGLCLSVAMSSCTYINCIIFLIIHIGLLHYLYYMFAHAFIIIIQLYNLY